MNATALDEGRYQTEGAGTTEDEDTAAPGTARVCCRVVS